METTSLSLLERLREPGQHESWARFARLYTPLLFIWARRLGLREQDAADLVQDVFLTLVTKLGTFRHRGTGSFRNWLYTVLLNRHRDLCRRRSLPIAPAGAAEPAADSEPDPVEEAEYQHLLVGRALQLMQSEFPAKTWKACWEHVVNGRPAAEVAAELGISPGYVYVAKSRVLNRLRQELQGLMD